MRTRELEFFSSLMEQGISSGRHLKWTLLLIYLHHKNLFKDQEDILRVIKLKPFVVTAFSSKPNILLTRLRGGQIYDQLFNLPDHKNPEVSKAIEYLIDSMELEDQSQIEKFLISFKSFIKDYRPSEAAELYERCLQQLVNEIQAERTYIQTEELTRIMLHLADIKTDDVVYNPFSGLSSFQFYNEYTVKYYSQEIEPIAQALACLRLDIVGKLDDAYLTQEDVFATTAYVKSKLNNKVDVVLATPPVFRSIHLGETEYHAIEEFFINETMPLLKDSGTLVAVVSARILQSTGKKWIAFKRDNLVPVLSKVIEIKGGAVFNTANSLFIIVLKKQKEKSDIEFVSLKSAITGNKMNRSIIDFEKAMQLLTSNEIRVRKQVSVKTLDKENFVLSPSRYLVEIPQIGIVLGDILSEIKPKGAPVETGQFFLSIGDVDLGRIHSTSSLKKNSRNKKQIALAAKGSILIGKHNGFSRFAYLKEQSYYDISKFYCFKITNLSLIYPEYLLLEFQKEYFQNQYSAYSTTSMMKTITSSDILKLVINSKSLKQQREIVRANNQRLLDSMAQELNTFKKESGLLQNNNLEVNYLQHKIRTPLSNLKSLVNRTMHIINEQIFEKHPEYRDLKKTVHSTMSLGEMFEKINRDVAEIESVLKISSKKQRAVPLEAIDFLKFFKSYIKDRGLHNHTDVEWIDNLQDFTTVLGNEKVMIFGNKDGLRQIFDNVIENAHQHAFLESDLSNALMIDARLDDNRQNLCIYLYNTGKPLVSQFTRELYITAGRKRGGSTGNGVGGSLIYELARNMEAKFNLEPVDGITVNSHIFETVFSLSIPLYNER